MLNTIKILGIAGSLRKDSYHMAILKAGKELVPKNSKLEIFEELAAIPPFNQDLENKPSVAVRGLKSKIRLADCILFATPEYNYSFPGILKNAIDWASRPYGDSAWEGKPAAIMSASVGTLGGVRAQYQLRQTFIFLNMFPLNQPEVIIPQIQEKINSKGEITDKYTKEKIRELLKALIDWTLKLQTGAGIPAEKTETYQYDHCYENLQN